MLKFLSRRSKLDLSGALTGSKNLLADFPVRATFPPVLRCVLLIDDCVTDHPGFVRAHIFVAPLFALVSMIYDFAAPSTLNYIDPTKCCMWGGKTITSASSPFNAPDARPLERIGLCPTAQYTSGDGLVLTGITPATGAQSITAIPPDSDTSRIDVFKDCGEPKCVVPVPAPRRFAALCAPPFTRG